MASALCTVAALSGGAAGRRASPQGGSKQRAVAQPLAAGAVTEAPPFVSAPRRRGGADELVAWKSIRQERWEGALEVEGNLPLWLVGE